jgi:hypothetical protein
MLAAPPLLEKTFTYCWAQFTSVSQIVSSRNLDAIVLLRYRDIQNSSAAGLFHAGDVNGTGGSPVLERLPILSDGLGPALPGQDSRALFHHDQLVGGNVF